MDANSDKTTRPVPAATPQKAQTTIPATNVLDTPSETAERKIHQQEARYQALQAATGDMLWTARADGHVEEPMDAWCASTGQSVDEARGWGWLDAVHPDDRERLEAIWRAALASGGSHATELRLRNASGGYRTWRVHAAPVYEPDGSIREWVGVCSDITPQKDAEAELRAAMREAAARARELEASFTAIADAVYIFDSEGRLVRTNAAGRDLLAQSANPDAYRRTTHERAAQVILRDERGAPLPKDQWPTARVLRGEELKDAKAMDISAQMQNGNIIYLNISAALIHDEQGAITGCVTVVRNVTQRRLLERHTHATLDALLGMAEALVVTGDEQPILAAQALIEPERPRVPATPTVAYRLTELLRTVLGCQRVVITEWLQALHTLRPVDTADAADQHAHAPSAQGSEPLLERALTALDAGDVVQLPPAQRPAGGDVLVAPMRIGTRLVGALVVEYSSRARPHTPDEYSLIRGVARLASVLIERERLLLESSAARSTEQALREANRRMGEVLSISSHELKNPLASVKGNVQLAARKLGAQGVVPPGASQMGAAPVNAADLLQRAERQIARMDRLVSDLLDVSRIETGTLALRKEQCDLAAIVREAIEEQQMIWPTRVITLEYVQPQCAQAIPAWVDGDRIGQVVTNFLSNALKYAPADRPVDVRVDVTDHEARVQVRDQGPGLPPEEHEHIWERFHRALGAQQQGGASAGTGLGLGLYISRSIIEHHNGRIGLISTPGAGSTFWFTLPLERPVGIP